jgi:cytochrome P450
MLAASNDTGALPPLFSPEFQRDPYATYRHYLNGPSLRPLEGRPGAWLLFGYEACVTLIRDNRLSAIRPASALIGVDDDPAEFKDLIDHSLRWLLFRDAPRHTELRKPMNRGFAPGFIERLRPTVNAIIERLLDKLQGIETIDLMKDFAYPLPVQVISELLGMPEELRARCVVLSNDIALWLGHLHRPTEISRLAQLAVGELESYFATIIRERRGKAKEDLLGLLMDAADNDEKLTEEELYAQCVLLLVAGHETTRNLIGNGIYTLLKHPAVYQELRDDESLLPSAVEELLRYESPVQALARTAKADLHFDGTDLPPGSRITFMIGAAHRDPRQFSDADRLDVRRAHNRHLAFGGDAHVCLGSTLARLEGRLAIYAVTRRFPKLRLADDQADWGPNFVLRGLNTLRVQTQRL